NLSKAGLMNNPRRFVLNNFPRFKRYVSSRTRKVRLQDQPKVSRQLLVHKLRLRFRSGVRKLERDQLQLAAGVQSEGGGVASPKCGTRRVGELVMTLTPPVVRVDVAANDAVRVQPQQVYAGVVVDQMVRNMSRHEPVAPRLKLTGALRRQARV